MRSLICLVLMMLAAAVPQRAHAVDTLTFEGIADGTPVGTAYADVTFTNAAVLSSGISLNEFEFPPHSGTNVAFDDSGAMSIVFSTPIADFSGYFTYSQRLTLTASDADGNPVGTAISLFVSNEALSGVAGSIPNEWIDLSVPGGFTRVVIAGNANGGSFVVDDIVVSQVPEPPAALLLGAGLMLAAGTARRKAVAQIVGGRA